MTTAVYSYLCVQESVSINKDIAEGFSRHRLIRLSLLLGLALLVASLATGCFSGRSTRGRSTTKYPLSGKSYVINGQRYHILANANGYREQGQASWYGEPFHGCKTANGETYNMHRISAAHKTLPLNTWVEVHNLNNQKKIFVRINDRGPFIRGRIIDLSLAAAKELDMYKPGLAPVRVTAVTDFRQIEVLKVAENKAATSPAPGKAAASKVGSGDQKAAAQKSAAPAKAQSKAEPKKAAVKTAQKPAAKNSASASNSYLVYVARTPDPDKAQNLANKIGQKFETVKIRVSYEQGQPYFQVRVEGFNGFNQAKAAQIQLAKLGYTEASVISN